MQSWTQRMHFPTCDFSSNFPREMREENWKCKRTKIRIAYAGLHFKWTHFESICKRVTRKMHFCQPAVQSHPIVILPQPRKTISIHSVHASHLRRKTKSSYILHVVRYRRKIIWYIPHNASNAGRLNLVVIKMYIFRLMLL